MTKLYIHCIYKLYIQYIQALVYIHVYIHVYTVWYGPLYIHRTRHIPTVNEIGASGRHGSRHQILIINPPPYRKTYLDNAWTMDI